MTQSIHASSSAIIEQAQRANTVRITVTFTAFAIDRHGLGETRTVVNSLPIQWVEFADSKEEQHHIVLRRLFQATNLREGWMWDCFVEQSGIDLSTTRVTLSVGDIVTIDAVSWLCAPTGWIRLGVI